MRIARPRGLKVHRPPFVIVADSREQAPFRFSRIPALASEGDLVVPQVVTRTLPTGDYSILGLEQVVAVERKSVPDLFGTLGRGRERFKAEFERLAAMRWAAVVVEGDYVAIRDCPPADSKVRPEAVEGTIDSWAIRYPTVHWFLCPDRRAAEIRTYRLLDKFWRVFTDTAEQMRSCP